MKSKHKVAAEAFARRLMLLLASQQRPSFVIACVRVCACEKFRFLATFLGLCVLVKVIMSSSRLFTVSQFGIVVPAAAAAAASFRALS